MHNLKVKCLSKDIRRKLINELQNYYELISLRLSRGKICATIHEPGDSSNETIYYDFKRGHWNIFPYQYDANGKRVLLNK